MRIKNQKSLIFNIIFFILIIITSQYSYAAIKYKTKLNIPAKSWLILDSKTNKIIASKNANLRLAPASTTKIMTAYVIGKLIQQKKISLNTRIRISKEAAKTSGSKMHLTAGRSIRIETLLKGLLINSGNDAAVALAQGSAGSVNKFVKLMNKEAKNLGLKIHILATPTACQLKTITHPPKI